MKISYTAGARSDLFQLRRYVIDRFDAATWTRSLAELRDRVALLAGQPTLGSVPLELQEIGVDRYRELAVGRNRILYEVHDDTVFILIVVDHRRDFRAVLSRRLLEPPTNESTLGAEA